MRLLCSSHRLSTPKHVLFLVRAASKSPPRLGHKNPLQHGGARRASPCWSFFDVFLASQLPTITTRLLCSSRRLPALEDVEVKSRLRSTITSTSPSEVREASQLAIDDVLASPQAQGQNLPKSAWFQWVMSHEATYVRMSLFGCNSVFLKT